MRLSQIEPVLGASRLDVGNWLNRQTMTSHFDEVVSGQARRFSYQNTVELALVAAFVAAGMPVSKAIAWARPFVTEARGPGLRFGQHHQWLVIPAGNFTKAVETAEPQLSALTDLLEPGAPPVFALVNIAEVFRRVDELFSAEG